MRCRVRISYLTVASFFVLRAERSQKKRSSPGGVPRFRRGGAESLVPGRRPQRGARAGGFWDGNAWRIIPLSRAGSYS